jgi:SAM-dependent methyltransferase
VSSRVAPEPTGAGADPGSLVSSRLARYVHLDRANRPYLTWQLDQFRPFLGRRVLEIGCGVGGVLAQLGPRECVWGIDVDPEILACARERFRDRPECRFAVADLGALEPALVAELAAQRFDTILCINVLEHVQDDLGALRTLERLLVPGGTLALLVPAHPALYGAYDRVDGHWRRYDRARLRALLAQTRLRPLRLHYFNAVGAIGWFVRYRLLRKTVHDQSHFGRMNRLLPLVRPLESWWKPPFGLSLVAVCRREGEVDAAAAGARAAP